MTNQPTTPLFRLKWCKPNIFVSVTLWFSKTTKFNNDETLLNFRVPSFPVWSDLVIFGNIFLIIGSEFLHVLNRDNKNIHALNKTLVLSIKKQETFELTTSASWSNLQSFSGDWKPMWENFENPRIFSNCRSACCLSS